MVIWPTTCGYAFRVNHGLIQKEYVDWKYRELASLTNSSPKLVENHCYFRTVSHPYFCWMRKIFYDEERKIVPESIENMITPLALAVWFMDDGTKEGHQVRLNTQSFSERENKKLSKILEAKLGIISTINRDKNYFRLRISDKSMKLFREMVNPFIIPSMRYKLSL
jgi:recombination protein RecA